MGSRPGAGPSNRRNGHCRYTVDPSRVSVHVSDAADGPTQAARRDAYPATFLRRCVEDRLLVRSSWIPETGGTDTEATQITEVSNTAKFYTENSPPCKEQAKTPSF